MKGSPRPSRNAASIWARSSPRWQSTAAPVTTTVRAGSRIGHGLAPFAAADSLRLDAADAQGASGPSRGAFHNPFASPAGVPVVREGTPRSFPANEKPGGRSDHAHSSEDLGPHRHRPVCRCCRGAHHRHPDHHQGIADVRRLLLAGGRPVREDRRQGVRRGGPDRPEERGDRGHRARERPGRPGPVLVRLLHPETERVAGDPRASVAARYVTFGNYYRAVSDAIEDMVEARLMLTEDAGSELQRLIVNGLAKGVPANKPPTAVCKNVTVAAGASVCSASASVNNGSSDPDGDPIALLQKPAGPYALGATPVTLTATDSFADPFAGSSSCTGTVTVVDATAPTISSAKASPSVLWPPNHKMVPVALSVGASDACDANAASRCDIASVSSNEPGNGRGDGNTAADWQITGKLTLNLRAERSGTGSGRVYTVGVACSDASGNAATRSVEVTVPQ